MKLAFSLVFSLASTVMAASPTLSGLYRVGNAGYVEFVSEAERQIGSSKATLACSAKPGTQLIVGSFEGNAFVGEILLCQEGPACDPEKSYPFLGVVKDGVMVGTVKLDTGCSSEGLDDSTLTVRPATATEKQNLAAIVAQSAAQRAANKKESEEITRLFTQAQKQLNAGDFAKARDGFARIVQKDPENALAWLSLGIAQKGQLKYAEAHKSILTATQFSSGLAPRDQGDIFYNLACVQVSLRKKKEAIASLKTAVNVGGAAAFAESLGSDPDLAPLQADKEFKAFKSQTIAAAKKP